jgi:hypothetical protein
MENPEKGNDAGLPPITFRKECKASSTSPGRDAIYALDDSMITWWQPEEGQKESYLEIDLLSTYDISAVRIIWRDIHLDYDKGILPEPFQYRIEALDEKTGAVEKVFLDCRDNDTDLLIDYRTFEMVAVRKVRFVITGTSEGIEPGVTSFTLFGKCTG